MNDQRRPAVPDFVRAVLTTVSSILGDRMMGVLAILAVAASLYPSMFHASRDWLFLLRSVEWTVVVAFAVEYLVNLLLAANKKDYVLSGWRLLDLAIIITCTLTLVPFVDATLRRAVALRLLSLVRAFGFGLRFQTTFTRTLTSPDDLAPPSVPRAFSVSWEGAWKLHPLSWSDFLDQAAISDQQWLDAYDVAASHLEELANSVKMPPALFSMLRSTSAYPRVKVIGSRLVANLWLPLVKPGEGLEIDRVSVLLSLAEIGPLLTVTPTDNQFQQRLGRLLTPPPDADLAAPAIEAYFHMVLEQNEEALAHVEIALRQMENRPVGRVGPDFFRLAFRLRRDLSQVKADLWRLGGILDAIKSERLRLPRQGEIEAFVVLSDMADYL
jgi:hypothetical protein